MSNFDRTIKKNGIIERLEAELDQSRSFEIRALMLMAVYEAFDLPKHFDEVLKRIGTELLKNPPSNKKEFFELAKNLAKMERANLEFEAVDQEQDTVIQARDEDIVPE